MNRTCRRSHTKRFAYNGSKMALSMLLIHLAQELRDTNIKVNSIHPGWVKTELRTEHAPLEIEDGAKNSVETALLGIRLNRGTGKREC